MARCVSKGIERDTHEIENQRFSTAVWMSSVKVPIVAGGHRYLTKA